MGEQLAAAGGGEIRLGGRLASTAVKDVGLAEDRAGVAGDRPDVLGLEAERCVADAGGQRGVNGAAQGGVEQGRRVAARAALTGRSRDRVQWWARAADADSPGRAGPPLSRPG